MWHVYMYTLCYSNYTPITPLGNKLKNTWGGAYILSIKKLGARAQKAGNRYDITGRQKLPPPPKNNQKLQMSATVPGKRELQMHDFFA